MMARKHALPADDTHWLQFNLSMLRMAEAVFVLQLTGWERSKGVQMEVKIAQTLQIPIAYWDKEYRPVVGV